MGDGLLSMSFPVIRTMLTSTDSPRVASQAPITRRYTVNTRFLFIMMNIIMNPTNSAKIRNSNLRSLSSNCFRKKYTLIHPPVNTL